MMWAMMIGYRGAGSARYRNGDKLFFVIRCISLDEGDPFGRQIILGEDGGHGAFIDAHVAVDAGVGIDVEHFFFLEIRFILLGMNAIDRADHDAGRVFGTDAGLGDDVGHEGSLLLVNGLNYRGWKGGGNGIVVTEGGSAGRVEEAREK